MLWRHITNISPAHITDISPERVLQLTIIELFFHRRLPSAAKRLKQADHRLQTREPHLRQIVQGLKQCLLSLQHCHQIDGPLAQSLLGDFECAPRTTYDFTLQPLLFGGLL